MNSGVVGCSGIQGSCHKVFRVRASRGLYGPSVESHYIPLHRHNMARMRTGPFCTGAVGGAWSPVLFASAVKSHLENSNLESRFRVSREIDELVEC